MLPKHISELELCCLYFIVIPLCNNVRMYSSTVSAPYYSSNDANALASCAQQRLSIAVNRTQLPKIAGSYLWLIWHVINLENHHTTGGCSRCRYFSQNLYQNRPIWFDKCRCSLVVRNTKCTWKEIAIFTNHANEWCDEYKPAVEVILDWGESQIVLNMSMVIKCRFTI